MSRKPSKKDKVQPGDIIFSRMKAPISSFTGRYSWLSNFYIEDDGKSLEHRFQARKTLIPEERNWVMDAPTPGQAKRRGRKVTLRPDWENIKLDVMREELERKFRDPLLCGRLLATGNTELIEGNYWGDRYWGVDEMTGKGKNHLGRLLMELRKKIKDSDEPPYWLTHSRDGYPLGGPEYPDNREGRRALARSWKDSPKR